MASKQATQGYMAGRAEAKPKKVLSHVTVKEGAKGGHVLEHHFEGYAHEMEPHVFGEGQSQQAHEHLAKVMHMPLVNPQGAEPQSPDDENAAETGKGD